MQETQQGGINYFVVARLLSISAKIQPSIAYLQYIIRSLSGTSSFVKWRSAVHGFLLSESESGCLMTLLSNKDCQRQDAIHCCSSATRRREFLMCRRRLGLSQRCRLMLLKMACRAALELRIAVRLTVLSPQVFITIDGMLLFGQLVRKCLIVSGRLQESHLPVSWKPIWCR